MRNGMTPETSLFCGFLERDLLGSCPYSLLIAPASFCSLQLPRPWPPSGQVAQVLTGSIGDFGSVQASLWSKLQQQGISDQSTYLLAGTPRFKGI